MLRLKIFILMTVFSISTIGEINKLATDHEVYWTCTSVDKEDNIFSGWSNTLEKAKKVALENCSSYTETGEACVASADPCEKMDLHASNQ